MSRIYNKQNHEVRWKHGLSNKERVRGGGGGGGGGQVCPVAKIGNFCSNVFCHFWQLLASILELLLSNYCQFWQ